MRPTTALTADAAQGSNSVQVASTAGFSVGQIVLLDEASGAGWQTDARAADRSGLRRIIGWYGKKHDPSSACTTISHRHLSVYALAVLGAGSPTATGPTAEIKQISAISGNTITFDSPVTISYRVSHQAQLYYWQTPHTRNAGVENMTLNGRRQRQYAISSWAAYCWA